MWSQRASNVRPYPYLGDPERWGGTDTLTVTVSPGRTPLGGVVPLETRQLVRVQAEDLVARAWDVLVSWTLDGTLATDTVPSLTLRLALGVGQTSLRAAVNLLPPPLVVPLPGSYVAAVTPGAPMFAAVPLSLPVPAVSLAATAAIAVDGGSDITVPVHDVTFAVSCLVAPRSLA